MAGNSFGQIFRLTTFGESHGPGVGAVIDGCPAGLEIDLEFIQKQLDKRRPGQSRLSSARNENDRLQILSGVFKGKSTGSPLAIFIANEDARTKDYEHLSEIFRPSHADFSMFKKFGHRDYRGGGRSSARETTARVAAGAVAQLLLKKSGIQISAFVSQVENVICKKSYDQLNLKKIFDSEIRCPDQSTAKKMIKLIEKVKAEGDSVGGVISCVIKDCPAGLGEPVFDRLHADLGKSMLSINAAKGFDIGSGFAGATMRGGTHNDEFILRGKRVKTKTNFSGGIQGGISNGMDIFFRVAFKPVSSILKNQIGLNLNLKTTRVIVKGRHDPCILPRAVVIVESMAALVLADHLLRQRLARI